MIYTIRTTVGRENSVMETLRSRIPALGVNVRALFHPQELKGYFFIEGELEEVEKAISGAPHLRGIIKKEIKIEELKKFLETKNIEVHVNRGDIIEITGGPFKNERGKVTRVDEAKDEVTIELIEAAIPIPITVSIGLVKLVEAAEKKE